ncbi:ATP-binding protein [Chloroflexi bacterium TSY]|nr:ATP-binding protein [Chloroflexi bacterium TSY]
MMNSTELATIISGGEDSFTEFKRDISQRSDFAGEMIAFANVDGGQILVGVGDDGTIVGLDDPQSVEEAIANIARHNCVPPLSPALERIVSGSGQTIILVKVPRRIEIPHENNSGQCYIRVGSTKRLCTPHERARLLQAASLVHYDEIPVAQTSVEQLDLNSFGEYFQRIYEQSFEEAGIPLVSTLSNMRFMVMDQRGNLRLSWLVFSYLASGLKIFYIMHILALFVGKVWTRLNVLSIVRRSRGVCLAQYAIVNRD